MSILSKYIANYGDLILQKLNLTASWNHFKWYHIHSGEEHKILNQEIKKSKHYLSDRQKWKYHKYKDNSVKDEFKYASTIKEKIENLTDEQSNNNNNLQCCCCGKVYKSMSWKIKHESKCKTKNTVKKTVKTNLEDKYVPTTETITYKYLKQEHSQAILDDAIVEIDSSYNTDDEDVSDYEIIDNQLESDDEDVSDYEIIDNNPILDTTQNSENEEFIETMKKKHRNKFFMLEK